MTIGRRIKLIREQKGLSQEQLGKLCKTTKQTIFKYESDLVTNIPMDRLVLIASALDVSPAYLMGWEKEAAATPPDDSRQKQFADLFSRLSEDQQNMILHAIKGLLHEE